MRHELRKGKTLSEVWLAHELRPYGIRPKTVRIGDQVGRACLQAGGTEIFRRYIPMAEVDNLKAELAERTVGHKSPLAPASQPAPAPL